MKKAPFVKKSAVRHYCPMKWISGSGYNHTAGDGRAKRKKCEGCGALLVHESGRYGVFVWRGDGRYFIEDAVATFTRVAAADSWAIANDSQYVSRWITDRA